MNGCQLSGFTKNAPTAMNARITVTLMATMMLLTVADSDTPSTSSMVTDSVMNTAGRLNSEVTTDARIHRNHGGQRQLHDRCPVGTISCVPAARSRRCAVAGSMTLVASASSAWLSVFTAMSSELMSA